MAAADPLHVWATGFGYGRLRPGIASSIDAGAGWRRETLAQLSISSDRWADLWAVAFSDGRHGWAVGEDGSGGLVVRFSPQQ